ncbi:glycosyltransferase [Arthrobacter sp. ov118]|uniref:glycosyltransferase n=1 Tax=Arthrobacter sp. ov118 TaxID=1761747 RepID=UPI0008ECF2D2|nr:glycosyltransferase [Arthrobacter sp. ov118]SFT36810.1 Glycosyl transferase family 2 [Arthrobacter sp. ov118]
MDNGPTDVVPAVDVVIAVHSSTRPAARALASIASAGLALNAPEGVRVTVVCHNISRDEISRNVPPELAAATRFLELRDGIPSPAGPFNYGLQQATAEFVCILGSDDYLEPGALRQWLELARSHSSAMVIAPQRHAGGALVRTPPVRVGRRFNLDAVKDRLSYRTAPLGLLRRSEIQRLGLEFSGDLRTGEDQIFSAKLWFGGGRIDYARGTGKYVVGADAEDRVTGQRREIGELFAFALELVADPWFVALPQAQRQALVTKLLRVHVFGVILPRADQGGWTEAEREELARVVRALLAAAPGAERPLSRADARLLRSILTLSPSAEMLAAAAARRKFGRPQTLIASSLAAQLHPEAPLRFMAASALL